jgi:YARHG domain
MKLKNYPIYLLAVPLVIIGFFCSREEPQPPGPPALNKATFAKRTESAFFSDSALRELRLLRNEIYARHGRTFESKDLQEHFQQCAWYHPSPAFTEASLSKTEREVVGSLQACETYLQKMTAKDRQHYNSVKVFSKAEAAFDTTIVDRIDYTGDGKKDKCITTIMQAENRVLVRHIIISGKDTIYNKEGRASFAPDKDLPLFDVYNNIRTAIRLSPFRASLRLVSPDIKKLFKGKKEIKQYLAHFKGQILLTVTSESAGCSYFWYTPAKKFETLYCE